MIAFTKKKQHHLSRTDQNLPAGVSGTAERNSYSCHLSLGGRLYSRFCGRLHGTNKYFVYRMDIGLCQEEEGDVCMLIWSLLRGGLA